MTHQHFVNRNHQMQLIRQMQQECVLECTSFVLNMKAEVEDDVECSIAFHGTNSQKITKKDKSEISAGWQWARKQYYGGRSGEKVQVHSFKLREMAAKGKEGPVGFWKGYRAFCRQLVKLRMARTAH